ncbi:hypothetical protein P280DRAFT_471932 [Massarina eburnea CBS 473.64]|uniref:Spindle pole body-associated protein cut12 domain-containing protein n=1 Tax=Massarina eburnea CBS 473.64 TaxID=1395130 RepID=A0A6A6RTQ3_9PLEO|nr:hypothetical protein P280DRAFT_471932 [Massarina eburnea CBS 473.64]
MFEWITGPRISNAIEDLKPDATYENTIIDAPETPAHQFAVKAFKHAIFGTPAPEEVQTARKLQKKQSPDGLKLKVPEMAPPKENAAPVSPSKQPTGIMKTPVTVGKSRKSVSFGAHVVDNEGKGVGKSGIPNDCPGKFPSPWTPGTELKADLDSEKKPRTKLTEALMDARTTKQPKPGQKPKARDDSDITMDMGAPRSESGKYWKEQYESYAERSEKETKRLIAKQQLAKGYAKKKDAEATELTTKLEEERKRYRRRELELERQNKDYQERLRQAMAENASAGVEITALKNRVSALEKSGVQESNAIPIYEDNNKPPVRSLAELDIGDVSYLSTKTRTIAAGKENSPPKPRNVRHQTLPDTPTRATPFLARPKVGVDDSQVVTVLGRSTYGRRPSQSAARPTLVSHSSEPSRPSLSPRKSDARKENVPASPFASKPKVANSSPLPMPSPAADPWMDQSDDDIDFQDKMAVPIGLGGSSYSRPPPRRAPRSRPERKAAPPADDLFLADAKSELRTSARKSTKPAAIETKPAQPEKEKPKATIYSPTDPRFDMSKITTHHAQGSAQVTKDRVELGANKADPKEAARRRLAERKKKKAARS